MKEGKGGNVAIDREDFSEEIGGVDEAGEEDKAEKVLANPLLQPVETHVYRLGLLRANRRMKPQDQSHIRCQQKEGEGTVGGGQGW